MVLSNVDGLTTLSQVEGQIQNSNVQMSETTPFLFVFRVFNFLDFVSMAVGAASCRE
jgi:hypothetical protein